MYTPDRAEFRRRAQRGNLIPVYREILADWETPVSAFYKLGNQPYSFLLESVEGGETLGRYSFLGTEPALILRSKGRQVVLEPNGRREISLSANEDPLRVLKRLLGRYRFVGSPDLPPFCGGAVGYMSYDLVRFFEELPEETEDDLNLPDTFFLFTDSLLIFDHVKHKIKVLNNAFVEDDPDAAYDRARAQIEATIERLRQPLRPPTSPPRPRSSPPEVHSNFTPAEFEAVVRHTKEYIAAGDIIQAVLSQRFAVPLTTAPFEVYRALRSINPSPYMYYLNYGDLFIVGSSPEILVTEKQGHIRLRPIAGTRRRGTTPEEDEALMRELLADEKERAEHIMLVDLGRNDVGRVSEYGSVRVDELMVIEKYSHVMHIVSNVVGKLRADCDQFDVLRACFPAGTVTGAPKIRAMEIIEELEPTKRGPYAGAIGYFSYSGSMDTCITIRTIVVHQGMAYIQAGAGIVADSDPTREHEECVNKAKALLQAIELAERGLE